MLSPEGSIIYANRTFAAMLGAPLGEVIGASIFAFVADADVEPLQRLLDQAPLHTGRREINLRHSGAGSYPRPYPSAIWRLQKVPPYRRLSRT